MDVTRYYVPPKPKKASSAEQERRHTAAVSRFHHKPRLPTPQAFFERQAKYKEDDRKAMLRFAQNKTAKHNLKLRRKELKSRSRLSQQRTMINEISNRLNALPEYPNKTPGSTKGKAEEVAAGKVEKTVETAKPLKASKPVGGNTEAAEVKGGGKIEFDGKGGVGFRLENLEVALNEEDEQKINRSVLENFFELKAPHRVGEIDNLLEEYKGKEHELFDSIAKEYNVVRANPAAGRIDNTKSVRDSLAAVRKGLKKTDSMHSFRNFEAPVKPATSFVEQKTTDAEKLENPPPKPTIIETSASKKTENLEPLSPQLYVPGKIKRGTLISQRSSYSAKGNHKMRNHRSLVASSVLSVASMTMDPENEEMREFQRALDKEIRDKLYSGEYVTSIMERGGRWWVNRDPPKQHPSQRKRKTLLEALRNGEVPLSV